jgi:hypothetical protein
MKNLLAALLLVPGVAWGTNAAIDAQTISTAPNATSTLTSAAITTTTGDTITVVDTQAGPTAPTVTDNMGNNACYTHPTLGGAGNGIHEVNDGTYLWATTCVNATGGVGHTFTVTLTSINVTAVAVYAVKNTPTSASLDASFTAYATAYPLSSPVTPSVAGDLIIGVGYSGSTNSATITSTGTPTYTLVNQYSGSTDFTALAGYDLTGATTSSQDPALTYSHGGQGFAVITLAFKPSSGGASAPPPQPSPFAVGVASLLPRGVNLASFAH